MNYTERMRVLREENRLTRRAVSEYLAIDQRTYSRYESGKHAMPSKMIERLCDYYNVSADYMLGRSENPYFDGNLDSPRKAGTIERKIDKWKVILQGSE